MSIDEQLQFPQYADFNGLAQPYNIVGSMRELTDVFEPSALQQDSFTKSGNRVVERAWHRDMDFNAEIDRQLFGGGPFYCDNLSLSATRYLKEGYDYPYWEHINMRVTDGDLCVASLKLHTNKISSSESQMFTFNGLEVTKIHGEPDASIAINKSRYLPAIRKTVRIFNKVILAEVSK